jgi:hypothetical protein
MGFTLAWRPNPLDDAFHPKAFRHLDAKRPWGRTPQSRLFKYEPLKLPRHIRLLKIINFDLLACKDWSATEPPRFPYYEMVRVPLASLPEYTALSYTWGRPKRTHVLGIAGAPFAITASLAEALRALPRIAPSEYLWIDQVCINQADEQEKNHQVQMMGEIYSNCHKVIIWTGGEIKGLQLAVDTYIPPGRQVCEGISESEALRNAKKSPVHPEPLHQLLVRPWFRRAWVIQEAVLPKAAVVVVAGSCQMTLEELFWITCWPRILQLTDKRRRDFQASKVVLDTIITLKDPSKTQTAEFRTGDHGFDSLVIDSLASSHASDPRDHVYAFLGFQKDPNISIVPDYTLSVTDAFTRAASAVIKGTNSLELLRFLPNNFYGTQLSQLSDEDHNGLPSWVPDWSARRREGRILRERSASVHGHTSEFDAANSVPHRPSQSLPGEESKLVASGGIIDSIAAMLSRVYGAELQTPRPRFFGLTDEEVTALDATALSDPTQKLRTRLVVMRTGGCIGVAPWPGVEEVLKHYDRGQSESDYEADDPLEWFSERRSDLSTDISAVSGKNKLCLVPSTASAGDLVAILHGFQVPIVLRPAEGGNYIVVGQCYLEDAMFGEAMTWKEDEADKFTLA